MFKLIQNIFESGERFPMLVDDYGVPNFWTTLYTSQRLRQRTQETITSTLRNINHFYKWQDATNRDLIKEIDNGIIPDSNFVSNIKDFCGFKDDYIQKRYFSKNKAKVVSLLELKLATVSILSCVGNDYQKRRMEDICNFLNFVGREIIKGKPNAGLLKEQLNSLGVTFKAHYPKSSYGNNNRALPHAEKEVFDQFLSVYDLNSKDNPFKGDDLKLRNYLLMQLLYWTGFRSGEVLSMTLDDINYDTQNPKVSVKRNHDDKNDPRKYQPVAKTNGRDIDVPAELRDAIDYYIHKVRSKFKASKTHPYIFVSHKGPTSGKPLSESTFHNRVVLDIKKLDPKLFEPVKRHGYRHYFNERFTERIDDHNHKLNMQISEAFKNGEHEKASFLKKALISDQDEIQMRMIVNGHASEDSAKPYLERHNKRKAQKVHKEMMEDISKKIHEIKKGI